MNNRHYEPHNNSSATKEPTDPLQHQKNQMIGLGNGTNGGGGNASAGEESEPEVMLTKIMLSCNG